MSCDHYRQPSSKHYSVCTTSGGKLEFVYTDTFESYSIIWRTSSDLYATCSMAELIEKWGRSGFEKLEKMTMCIQFPYQSCWNTEWNITKDPYLALSRVDLVTPPVCLRPWPWLPPSSWHSPTPSPHSPVQKGKYYRHTPRDSITIETDVYVSFTVHISIPWV